MRNIALEVCSSIFRINILYNLIIKSIQSISIYFTIFYMHFTIKLFRILNLIHSIQCYKPRFEINLMLRQIILVVSREANHRLRIPRGCLRYSRTIRFLLAANQPFASSTSAFRLLLPIILSIFQ